MRLAGLFSHVILAFVCLGLTYVAFEGSRLPGSVRMTAPIQDTATFPSAPVAVSQTEDRAHVATASPVTVSAASSNSQMNDWASTARFFELDKSPAAGPPATAPAAASSTAPAPEPSVVVAKTEPALVVQAPAPIVVAAATPEPSPLPAQAAAEPPALAITPLPSASVVAAVPPASPAVPADAATVSPDPPADTGGTPGLKPAKALFGAVATPAPLAARAIGGYAKGCLSGGQALPVDGPTWQAMRLSRNRNWGHPKLIKLIEKLATDGKEKDGWPGLLVGDLAQPRGGPMLTGHASHQIGLDADLWLTPMPDRRLSNKERETIEATSMLSEDPTTVNRDVWTQQHFAIIKRAASYPEVERIFIHPAIKQVLCYAAKDDRAWLSKVRAYWGHHYHFHVRMHCPAGSGDCEPQKSVPGDDGCGKELDDWLKLVANVKPAPAPLPIPQPPVAVAKPPKEKPPMTLDQLPNECRVVLSTGNPELARDIAAAAKAAEIAKGLQAIKGHHATKSAEKSTPAQPSAKSAHHTSSAHTLGKSALPDPSKPHVEPAPAAAPKPHANEKKTLTQ